MPRFSQPFLLRMCKKGRHVISSIQAHVVILVGFEWTHTVQLIVHTDNARVQYCFCCKHCHKSLEVCLGLPSPYYYCSVLARSLQYAPRGEANCIIHTRTQKSNIKEKMLIDTVGWWQKAGFWWILLTRVAESPDQQCTRNYCNLTQNRRRRHYNTLNNESTRFCRLICDEKSNCHNSCPEYSFRHREWNVNRGKMNS